jgi:glucose-fructose oxidoreductase
VRLQTAVNPSGEDIPIDVLQPPFDNVLNYFIHCLETGEAVTGPLSLATSRLGQRIVDTAVVSSREKRTVALIQ